jgi:hypothetical protein
MMTFTILSLNLRAVHTLHALTVWLWICFLWVQTTSFGMTFLLVHTDKQRDTREELMLYALIWWF